MADFQRQQHHAPGTRVEIRDAEWRIRRVDYSADGGYVLACEGLSQLVQGREALFLSKLETIRVLDPNDTELVDDGSSNFAASLLYIDSLLRKTAPSDERIHLGHRAAVDELAFQLEPTLQALRQPRQRILIADAVGLGKTLEAGILVSELIARSRGKRILVLATKSMLTQFQQEFWNRFTIPLTRLDSVGLQRVRNRMTRIRRQLEKTRDDEHRIALVEDLDSLSGLEAALAAIGVEQFSKYRLLREQLGEGGLNWTPDDPEDRLVIFTESLVTLAFLAEHLPKDLGLEAERVAILRGDLRDSELMDTVERFNRRESPIRLLLCSDVAAEGINLHHLSHRMIHFDIPWSLMVFQQRNGRIDRYGQTRRPRIRYLLTDSEHPEVRGDQRVLEVLIRKDEQAGKNIGDPSEFLGLYDQRAEEDKVADVIEQDDNEVWRAFEALMDGQVQDSENPLANFLPEPAVMQPAQAVGPLLRVFPDGLEYARAALRWFAERGEKLDAGIEDDTRVFWLTAPDDLKPRIAYLPREARPEHDHFKLTPDKAAIDREILRTRQEEDAAWPALHFLWPLHPVMEWLSDRALNAFGRHTAPVLRLPGKLAGDEHIVLIHGGFPNRRGHVLIQDWIGVRLQGREVTERLDWPALQQRLDLRPGKLPNPGRVGDTEALRGLLRPAVTAARARLMALKQAFEAERAGHLDAQRRRLAELKARHESRLQRELDRSEQPEAFKARRRDERRQHIDRVFRDYRDWLDNTQSTEAEPYLQVAAVFTGDFPDHSQR